MRNLINWCVLTARSRLARPVTVLGLIVMLICAYGYSAVVADLGDTYIAPGIVQEALQAFISVQIGKALWQRWEDFSTSQRLWWVLIAVGVLLNLGRGYFSGTPLTLSYLLLHVGLMGVTWRLMAASRRETRLARSLSKSEQIRFEQDQTIADLQADLVRVGKQSKHFEALYYQAKEEAEKHAV